MSLFNFNAPLAELQTLAKSSLSSFASPSDGGVLTGSPTQSTMQNKQTTRMADYTCIISCKERGIRVIASLPPDFDWGMESSYDTPLQDLIGDAVSSFGKTGDVVSRGNGLALTTQALTAKFWSGSASSPITLPLIFQAEVNEVAEVIVPLKNLLKLTTPKELGGARGGMLQAPGPRFDLTKAASAISDSFGSELFTKTSVAGGPASVGYNDSSETGKLTNTQSSESGFLSSVYSAIGNASKTITDGLVSNVISLQLGRYMFFESVVITNVSQKHYVQPVGTSSGRGTGNMQRVEVSVTFEPFYTVVERDLDTIFMNGGR